MTGNAMALVTKDVQLLRLATDACREKPLRP